MLAVGRGRWGTVDRDSTQGALASIGLVTWLVTGGAGYIGAHVVRALQGSGRTCVIVDDLSTGVASRVPVDVPLVLGDIHDGPMLQAVMRDHHVDGVVHLAAKKSPTESMADPLLYYRENVGGLESVLSSMVRAGVTRIVLSSSSSVYGVPSSELVDEDAPLAAINPYGMTKAVCELMARDCAAAYGIAATILRYFNVAGAGGISLGDVGVFNLIPLALRAVTRGERPAVFGTDFPTPDGSGVRDYIHVTDLAEVHALAAARLESVIAGVGQRSPDVYNVGRGEGVSVLEVLAMVRSVTGHDLPPLRSARRAGDPPSVVGDTSKITRELGWQARHDLRQMVESAWESWRVTHMKAPGSELTPSDP